MIVLFGGTAETGAIAEGLLARGRSVLVCTATDAELDLPAACQRRCGRLDETAMATVLADAELAIDATHPYAVDASRCIAAACAASATRLIRYLRPASGATDAIIADDHEQAARIAGERGTAILLTTGSRNLAPYLRVARANDLAICARVLPHDESLAACHAAGLRDDEIIAERGPFDIAANRAHIQRCGAGTLIAKDGGEAARIGDRIAAARQCGCAVVLIRRPDDDPTAATSIEALLDRLQA